MIPAARMVPPRFGANPTIQESDLTRENMTKEGLIRTQHIVKKKGKHYLVEVNFSNVKVTCVETGEVSYQ